MHSKKTNKKNVRNVRNGTPRPTPEITNPAVFSPGVTVELEPDVSGGRKQNTKVKLPCFSYSCIVGL